MVHRRISRSPRPAPVPPMTPGAVPSARPRHRPLCWLPPGDHSEASSSSGARGEVGLGPAPTVHPAGLDGAQSVHRSPVLQSSATAGNPSRPPDHSQPPIVHLPPRFRLFQNVTGLELYSTGPFPPASSPRRYAFRVPPCPTRAALPAPGCPGSASCRSLLSPVSQDRARAPELPSLTLISPWSPPFLRL